MKDVFPTIFCDMGVGVFMENVEFDAAGICNFMRARGYTDEQILRVKIFVSSRDPEAETGDGPDAALNWGKAYKQSKDVILYPRTISRLISYQQKNGNIDMQRIFSSEELVDEILSEIISDTIGHECEHLKVKFEGELMEDEISRALGALAIMPYDEESLNLAVRLEEERCREAGRSAPPDLVSFRLRHS